MDDFWRFAAGFWWLAFPILGMAGGAYKAWERGAKDRHQRRLEVIEAKQGRRAPELGPAQAAAPASAPIAAPADEGSRAQRLTRLLAEHDEITARWLDYELDAAKVIAFPAMTDVRQPLTSAFHRAKRRADELRPESVKQKMDDATFEAYRDAVHEFALAFETAEQDARRLRDTGFTPAERQRLGTAQQLLRTALDQSATRAERNLAYRRVREELEGLIVLSDGAVIRLEERVAMQVTGPAAATADEQPHEPEPVEVQRGADTAPPLRKQADPPRTDAPPAP